VEPPDEVDVLPVTQLRVEWAPESGPTHDESRRRYVWDPEAGANEALVRTKVERAASAVKTGERSVRTCPQEGHDTRCGGSHKRIGELVRQSVEPFGLHYAVAVHECHQIRIDTGETSVSCRRGALPRRKDYELHVVLHTDGGCCANVARPIVDHDHRHRSHERTKAAVEQIRTVADRDNDCRGEAAAAWRPRMCHSGVDQAARKPARHLGLVSFPKRLERSVSQLRQAKSTQRHTTDEQPPPTVASK
jgi:hypothetical protein